MNTVPTKQDIEALEKARLEARRAHDAILDERAEQRRREVAALDARLDATYRDETTRRCGLFVDADRALADAIDARIVGGAVESAYPVGTRFLEWQQRGRFPHPSDPYEKTGVVAVWEIFRQGAPYPDGHYRPKAGAQGLRILKADGTPSKRFVQLYGSPEIKGFYPESSPPKNRQE